MTVPFKFIDNVPEGVRSFVHNKVQEWINCGDSPVIGVRLPNGVEVDFCRRPWPEEVGVTTTVGAERDIDELHMQKFLEC